MKIDINLKKKPSNNNTEGNFLPEIKNKVEKNNNNISNNNSNNNISNNKNINNSNNINDNSEEKKISNKVLLTDESKEKNASIEVVKENVLPEHRKYNPKKNGNNIKSVQLKKNNYIIGINNYYKKYPSKMNNNYSKQYNKNIDTYNSEYQSIIIQNQRNMRNNSHTIQHNNGIRKVKLNPLIGKKYIIK